MWVLLESYMSGVTERRSARSQQQEKDEVSEASAVQKVKMSKSRTQQRHTRGYNQEVTLSIQHATYIIQQFLADLLWCTESTCWFTLLMQCNLWNSWNHLTEKCCKAGASIDRKAMGVNCFLSMGCKSHLDGSMNLAKKDTQTIFIFILL